MRCLNKKDIGGVKTSGDCNTDNKDYKPIWIDCDKNLNIKKQPEKSTTDIVGDASYYGIMKKGKFNIRNVSTLNKKYGLLKKDKDGERQLNDDETKSVLEQLEQNKDIEQIANELGLDIDKRKKSRSRTCKTSHKDYLLGEVIPNLNIDYGDNFEVEIKKMKLNIGGDTTHDEMKQFIKNTKLIKELDDSITIDG